VSFAFTSGSDSPSRQVMPMGGLGPLPQGFGETWLGVHTGLSFSYRWTTQLTPSIQIINRMAYLARNHIDGDTDTKVRNKLGVVPAITYRVRPNVTLQSGVQFMLHSYTETNESNTDIPNFEAGTHKLFVAIPIHFRIVY
jgi:hypothetical protein